MVFRRICGESLVIERLIMHTNLIDARVTARVQVPNPKRETNNQEPAKVSAQIDGWFVGMGYAGGSLRVVVLDEHGNLHDCYHGDVTIKRNNIPVMPIPVDRPAPTRVPGPGVPR